MNGKGGLLKPAVACRGIAIGRSRRCTGGDDNDCDGIHRKFSSKVAMSSGFNSPGEDDLHFSE